ncbi:hypothetical protein BHM03_00027462 [Ensete ventricosum]|nr:hypothetical protein BHM03_00027462 [Ensete ventricosum]
METEEKEPAISAAAAPSPPQLVGLLRKDPRALIAAALRMYWCGVDTGTGDGDGGEVHHEHSKADGEWCQHLQAIYLSITHGDVGVAGATLRVCGGKNGVDEDEGADDLGSEGGALGVAGCDLVGSTTKGVVLVLHDPLHDPYADDGSQALRHYLSFQVKDGEVGEGETRDAGRAVNEDEDHATKGPRDAKNANAAALVGGVLLLVADDGCDGDVEEEQRGHELSDEGAVEGPETELAEIQKRRRRRVPVVLCRRLLRLTYLLRHDDPPFSFSQLSLFASEHCYYHYSRWLCGL